MKCVQLLLTEQRAPHRSLCPGAEADPTLEIGGETRPSRKLQVRQSPSTGGQCNCSSAGGSGKMVHAFYIMRAYESLPGLRAPPPLPPPVVRYMYM